jgi:hypothetical protein
VVVSCWPRAGSSQSDGSEASRSSSAAFERLSSTSKELLGRGDALGEVLELLRVVAHCLAMLPALTSSARERQEFGEHPRRARPGVPTRSITCPRPARRSATSVLSRATSRSRPTRGVRDNGSVRGRGPTRRDAVTGSDHPFSVTSPRLEHEPFVQARRRPGTDRDRTRPGGALEPCGHVRHVAERDGLRVPPRCRRTAP